MIEGRAPDGRPYPPAFPYDHFTGLQREDVEHLWAHLQSVPPSPTPRVPHDVAGRATSRFWLGLWRTFYFREGEDGVEPDDPPDVQRGAYLGTVVGHCGGCHTPRNGHGARKRRKALEGQDEPPEPAPPLHDLGWSEDQWGWFLETGMTAEGDVVGGEMWRVVEEGTAKLPDGDREALAAWLYQVTTAAHQR